MGEVRARGDEEASSVVSSTFSLGDPVATDSAKDDIERRVGGVVEDLKNTSLADTEGSDSSTSVTDKAIASGPASGMDVDDGNLPKIPLSRCLFCNYDSPSISLNAVHMERIHGMFIPERNFLLDLDGLIDHLQQKIQYFHECLYCGKLKPSVFGLQTHMRDVGHCKIPFDTEAEQLDIGDYYDFTSTYSDGDSEGEVEGPRARTSGGVKLGARREAAIDADGDEDMEDGDGWETDSYESSLDSADLTAVPLDQRIHQYEKLNQHPHHAHTDPRPHHNRDGWHSHAHKHVHAVFYSDYELHLPSGRVAGHRSLNKYFKQNLHNHPSAEERVQRAIEAAGDSDSEEEENRQLARRHQVRGRALVCRANGGLGMNGVTSEKRKEVRVAEKRSRKVEERERRKFQWGNNKQRNHQKHFRVSVMNSHLSDSMLMGIRILYYSDTLPLFFIRSALSYPIAIPGIGIIGWRDRVHCMANHR